MFKSQEIADLQARITTLETELKTAGDSATKLQAELDKAKADLAQAESQVTAHATTITDLQTKLTAAQTAQTAAEERAKAAEASITDQVNTRLAAAGIVPIERDPKAQEKTGQGKPQADSSLPARQRTTAAMEGFSVFAKK